MSELNHALSAIGFKAKAQQKGENVDAGSVWFISEIDNPALQKTGKITSILGFEGPTSSLLLQWESHKQFTNQ